MLQFEPYGGDLDHEIQRFINQIQGQKRPVAQFRHRGWRPAVDLFETDDMVVALVELAGVDASEVDVTVEDRALIIRGQRGEATDHRPHSYHLMEMHHGPFERMVPLPTSVDAEHTKASTRNGLLEICMPKARSQQIAITVHKVEPPSGD